MDASEDSHALRHGHAHEMGGIQAAALKTLIHVGSKELLKHVEPILALLDDKEYM